MIVYRELNSITRDLGVSSHTLYALANNITGHYHTVSIPKRSGGSRMLSVPDEALKHVQRRIAQRLLSRMPVSRYATAYRYGRSVLDNALPHAGANQLLKLDIADFFDNILYAQVKEYAFPEEVYAEPLRVLLSILCYHGDALPQGAPTSPAITNLILRPFDETVGAWCRERRIRYTRYCDDMTFSGTSFDADAVISYVKALLRDYGLYLNEKKTKRLGRGVKKTVTGIVVNEHPNVSADYRRVLRQELYYCRRFGVSAHLERIGSSDTREHYLQILAGRVNYVLSITPGNREMQQYRAWLKEQLRAK